MTPPMDKLRRAIEAFDATPRHGSLATEHAAQEIIKAARRVVQDASRSPYIAAARVPHRPSMTEDDGA